MRADDEEGDDECEVASMDEAGGRRGGWDECWRVVVEDVEDEDVGKE